MTSTHAYDFDLIVIGWGKGGKTLAGKAAAAGKRVAIIERDPAMYGGTCINVGCLPTKALVHYAGLYHESAKLGAEHTFEQGAKAYAHAAAHKASMVEKLNAKNYSILADKETVTPYTGEARFSDTHTIVIRGEKGEETITGEKIVINTGARSRWLDIPGATHPRVHDSRSILNVTELPRRLAIIGAGFIGLEFASYFASFGTEVQVLQHDDKWLPSEDRDDAERIKTRLEELGVTIAFNTSVDKFEETSGGLKLTISGPEGTREEDFDRALIAIGRQPNTENLGLEEAGVTTGERGEITVTSTLKTSCDHIWAVGDVKGGPQFTFISLDDSRIVLPQLLGDQPSHDTESRPEWATVMFTNPPFARVGLNEQQAKEQGVNYELRELPTASIPKAHVIGETTGHSKILVGDSGEILGASLFHYEAHEMINVVTQAMNAGMKADELGEKIFTHPTFTESLNDILG